MPQRQERSLPLAASSVLKRWRLGKPYLKICLCRVIKLENSEYDANTEFWQGSQKPGYLVLITQENARVRQLKQLLSVKKTTQEYK